jgi:hypothetical protein
MWCCTGDEGLLALRSRPAGGGFKPPSAALAEDCRGERDGKGALEASGGDQEDVALNAPVTGFAVDASLLDKAASKPGVTFWPGMSLAGARLLARWCPAWRRREPDLRLPCGTWESAPRYRPEQPGSREFPKRMKREGQSTVAGRAGGPARSSGEVPARCGGGGAKGPAHLWFVHQVNQASAWEESRGRAETGRQAV